MRTSELILAIVAANGGYIEGKTVVQKIGYFCELRMSVRDNPVFLPHFYGPYSAQVDFELDKLVALGFLEQSTRTTINDRTIYGYKLTKQGKQVLQSISSSSGSEIAEVTNVVKTCKKYAGLNPLTLSYAAKVHLIAAEAKHPVTENDIIIKAKDIGWKMNEKSVMSGARLLTVLKLAN
ncbi:MAG: hypothetical protein ACRECH_10725 [Nitrososphaerales archaeon]